MPTELPILNPTGPLMAQPTDALLDEASRRLQLELPPSYREFARRYGYGLTAGLFMIAVPVDTAGAEWSEDLVERSAELAQELAASVDGKYISYKPDGTEERVRRLVPFGASENGDILAWDPRERAPDGEYAVYVIGARKYGVSRVAEGFAEFLNKVLEPNTGGVLARATFTLEATFEPRAARS
ncbi:SMI1/KNR4 family protein [Myxococcus faecalis]|uniref:SMI1/KNR4 family protein n=1 Tax=Myxococcus faecalis TaxID=3115646 RepID=UPI003CE76D57